MARVIGFSCDRCFQFTKNGSRELLFLAIARWSACGTLDLPQVWRF
ncbi:MAG: hypothetical protein SVX43_23780 [Cyanobacteriota bacterium]|nr:hypothetical protein [Cyanobacteriota bacterium]